MTEKLKFLQVKDALVEEILTGAFGDGDAIPTEAQLAASHAVSRVTVRKALDALKADGVLHSTQGSGTRVALRRTPVAGDFDLVVVAASVYEPFFAEFFGEFQRVADARGVHVIFKQETKSTRMDQPEFYTPLLARGIRDFVLWPAAGFRDRQLLPRLRGVGANLVMFDHLVDESVVDCVALDSRGAVEALIDGLAEDGLTNLRFVSWSDSPLSGNFLRETAFRRYPGGNREISRVARAGGPKKLRRAIASLLDQLDRQENMPQAFVAVSHDMGSALAEGLLAYGDAAPRLAVVDALENPLSQSLLCIEQPIPKMASRSFQCLCDQHGAAESGAKAWSGRHHLLKGRLTRP